MESFVGDDRHPRKLPLKRKKTAGKLPEEASNILARPDLSEFGGKLKSHGERGGGEHAGPQLRVFDLVRGEIGA